MTKCNVGNTGSQYRTYSNIIIKKITGIAFSAAMTGLPNLPVVISRNTQPCIVAPDNNPVSLSIKHVSNAENSTVIDVFLQKLLTIRKI